MSAPEMTCNVCGQSARDVRCSAFGAWSHAYCKECADKPAEPIWTFQYLFDEVSDNGEGLQDYVNDFFAWRDGAYISWQDYVAERLA